MLRSKYIIDGVPQALSPAQMLEALGASLGPSREEREIVDETLDPAPAAPAPGDTSIQRYLEMELEPQFSLTCPEFSAKSRLIDALLRYLCSGGELPLEELTSDIRIIWPSSGTVGSGAAFYSCIRALCEYMEALDMHVDEVSLESGKPELIFTIGAGEGLPAKALPDEDSWIVYIPFESSEYRLGGSSFALAAGISGGPAPALDDPDYFIDCYEVARELVMDGIVLAARPVGVGGLASALKEFGPVKADISDLRRANPGLGACSILFSELPGLLVQIKDGDFDYLDAELLLQDVLFYPLGHPSSEMSLNISAKSGIEAILDSLSARR